MVLSLQGDTLRLLEQVGFTETQAKIYITLCQMGQTDAKSLAKQSDTPRQAAYRTLGELQQKGMVEKIIAIPQQYRAIPIHDGLSIMIGAKAKEYASIAEKAQEFIKRYEAQTQLETAEDEYKISIVEGKETVIKKIQSLTEACSQELLVVQTIRRWIQVNSSIYETILEALERGVKYRVIIENENELAFPKDLKPILKHPNYNLRVTNKLKVNAALFDNTYGVFSFYPARLVGETPIIATNHPSLLVGFRDYFNNQWRLSRKLEI
jgi:HTH-type transcriptional regulator, sugar sensing transcriptional regulator